MNLNAPFDEWSGNSGFYNSGYWTPQVVDLRSAQLNLIAQLTEHLSRKGRILDVACGLGAAALYLGSHYEPDQIYGIDIDELRIARCKQVSPRSTFAVMSATHLAFEGNYFEDVICIASAVYFQPRETYLTEAYRVLKPGGRIAMYDVIEKAPNPENGAITDIEMYRAALQKAGFSAIVIEDISQNVFRPLADNLESYVQSMKHLDIAEEATILKTALLTSMDRWKCYLLIFATK